MDWTKGFSARYYVSIVDPNTWRDTNRIEIISGSITRSLDGLRQSADIEVVDFQDSTERLIRIWLDARQDNDSSHIPLFTGYATSPGRKINGMLTTRSLQCYSILKPAYDILLPRGWYAPADADAIWQIKKLLKVTNSPVEILGDTSDPNLKLKQAIIAEQNETNLSMVEAIIGAISQATKKNWRMIIKGDGTIQIGPRPEEYSVVFDSRDNDILEPQVTDDYDWYSCPNIVRAISDNTFAEFRDENPDSPFSIQNRGREIWVEETNCVLNDKETLADYARRRLKEYQQVGRIVSYSRRFIPDLNIYDIVRLNYPAQDLTGSFIITNQNITLGYNAKTSEEVMQV